MTLVLLILPKLYSLYLQTSPPPPRTTKSTEYTLDPPASPTDGPVFKNGYEAWLDQKCRHLYRLSSTLSTVPSRNRFWNRFVNHTIHAHVLRFVHFSTQPVLFYSTLIFTLMLVTVPHFWGNFVPAAGDQGQGYFYLQGIYLPHAGGHLGGGLGAASVDHAGPDRVGKPLSVISGAIASLTGGRIAPSLSSSQEATAIAGTWIPMADTWMSTIWTVFYDLVIFLYYLTLCATPSGYLYSPTNPHRLRPYHRTWYVRCLIFGIWVYRCCSVLMTAELYGPSVVWSGIGTWWLAVVGWLMFMVGWSRSRNEKDIISLHGEEEASEEQTMMMDNEAGPRRQVLTTTYQHQEKIRLVSSDWVNTNGVEEEEEDESDEEHDGGVNGTYSDETKALLNGGSNGTGDSVDPVQALEAGANKKRRHQRGRGGKPAQSKPHV